MFGFRRKRNTTKILLAAIAKDEAAYLPEWIFHHLYFGLDQIQIYVNRTSDNTQDIADYFSSNPKVSFINSDEYFFDGAKNPQIDLYKAVFANAFKSGFSHVLFIDIDEFWTPLNLQSSIQSLVSNVQDADTISFQWCNKLESSELFSPALSPLIQVLRAPQVKSVLKLTRNVPKKMHPHNIMDETMLQKLSDGSIFRGVDERMSRLREKEQFGPLKPAFILHRIFRSQQEFVAMLAKFNPEQQVNLAAPIKLNRRRGYPASTPDEQIAFDLSAFEKYHSYINESLRPLSELIKHGQSFVLQDYRRVLNIIEAADSSAEPLITATLRNITLEEPKRAHAAFLSRVNKQP
jgi:hypothetical protein